MHRSSVGTALLVTLAVQACASGQPGPVRASSPQATRGVAVRAAAATEAEADAGTPLYGDLGPYARTIVTSSDRAQAYFDEGLLFMYAFGTSIAVESFMAAQREDPGCAACYRGEAWARAPYLNGGMSPGEERLAYAAIQKARELAPNASEVEGAIIDALAVRFEAEPQRDRRKMLDTLYADHMGRVAARFPQDLDVQTLHAEALMLLRPRRGDVDLAAPDVGKILPILEGVLARNIRHPFACHLYIHLVEASPEPQRAEACSDHLGASIAVSHIRHMPSHIYMNIGRYGDAVLSNRQAWHADQKADYGGPPGVYPAHNLHMLLFAAVMDGQSAVAVQAARDLARVQGPWEFYVPVTMAAFGRWADILEVEETSEEPMDVVGWAFARGLAHLRMGHAEVAAGQLAAIDAVLAEVEPDARFRFHAMADIIALPRAILAAEIAHARGASDEAISILRRAVEVEDGLVYDEPEPWHIPVRHVLGAILLEAGHPAEAEAIYREAIEDHTQVGWALFGLEQALTAQGRTAEAQEARRDFEERWSRADVWLRSSRF